jgi:3-oxoacyl-[acyl-carrier protein] reductase
MLLEDKNAVIWRRRRDRRRGGPCLRTGGSAGLPRRAHARHARPGGRRDRGRRRHGRDRGGRCPRREEHARKAASAGGIDIALNAVGIPHVQGTPFAELSYDDFATPITAFTRTNFLTAKAVAPHMVKRGSGVILTLSTPGSRMAGQGFLGYGVTCAAIEAFSRILAGELGPNGIRVVCLRPHAIPETVATSYVRDVFNGFADQAGTTVEAMLADWARSSTLLGRFPTLAEVADYAAFLASDRAGATTGAIANLTSGSLVD